jgi:subtilisin family serine protease
MKQYIIAHLKHLMSLIKIIPIFTVLIMINVFSTQVFALTDKQLLDIAKGNPVIINVGDDEYERKEMYYGEDIVLYGYNFGKAGNIYFNYEDGSRRALKSANQKQWSNDKIIVPVPYATNKITSIRIAINNNQGAGIPLNIFPRLFSDENSDRQYYLKDLSNISPKEKNEVIIAIIDDGIYLNHEDLKGNIWKNPKEIFGDNIDNDNNGYIDDHAGWNFIDNNKDLTEKGSHGTAVAGIIGAANNKIGIKGVSSKARFMSLIVCHEEGCPSKNIIESIYYAVNNGAQIINLSLGSEGAISYTSKYDEVIQYALDNNVFIVTASGNGDTSGGNGYNLNDFKMSPVCNEKEYNGIMGVGASTKDHDKRTSWSNYGYCVDVYAPGEQIYSTLSPIYKKGKHYGYQDGTSFSAPIVSGLAALLISDYPNIANKALHKYIYEGAQSKQGNLLNIRKTIYTIQSKYNSKDIYKKKKIIKSPASKKKQLDLLNNVTQDIKANQESKIDIIKDANQSQYKNAILYLKDINIIKGYDDGTFKPFNFINRAEFTKIVIGATDLTLTGKNCFIDINNEWFAPYVCTAQANGVIQGYKDGSFRPNKEINIAESLKITFQALNISIRDPEEGEAWYNPYVEYAKQNNLFLSTFKNISQNITREEMAELIYRIINISD